MIKSHRDLEVWRLGLDLAEAVYRCTAEFPKSEMFGLSSQMRRAAVSVPSNIAEGRARSSIKEFLQFLRALAEVSEDLLIDEFVFAFCRHRIYEPGNAIDNHTQIAFARAQGLLGTL